MARTFPAALALVVALTGTSLPAVAAPVQSPASPIVHSTTSLVAAAPASAPAEPGASWSLPLTGISQPALK
ncbi:MAG: hypothetical protein M3Y20_06325, partial [Actinomycetota bacterium]|nr:hypothetical protein [Actinomycetota bacterium]